MILGRRISKLIRYNNPRYNHQRENNPRENNFFYLSCEDINTIFYKALTYPYITCITLIIHILINNDKNNFPKKLQNFYFENKKTLLKYIIDQEKDDIDIIDAENRLRNSLFDNDNKVEVSGIIEIFNSLIITIFSFCNFLFLYYFYEIHDVSDGSEGNESIFGSNYYYHVFQTLYQFKVFFFIKLDRIFC